MDNVTLDTANTVSSGLQGSIKEPIRSESASHAKQIVEAANAKPMSKDKLKSMIFDLNEEIKPFTNKVEFGFNEDMDGMQVTVKDSRTDEILSRFPSEDAERISRAVKELVGVIFDKKA